MGYKSLAACVADLEKHGHLIRIKEEVDPYLEMAAIHLRVYENQGPALFFEKIKVARFRRFQIYLVLSNAQSSCSVIACRKLKI